MIRAIAPLLIVVVAACGGPEPGIDVADARIGEAPAGADAAAYLDLRSGADDRLVSVDATVAGGPVATSTTLHEIVPVEGGGIMQATDVIELPAGDAVRLTPLGDHVMLEDLAFDLAPGDSVTLVLHFEHHAPVTIEAEVVSLLDLAEEVWG